MRSLRKIVKSADVYLTEAEIKAPPHMPENKREEEERQLQREIDKKLREVEIDIDRKLNSANKQSQQIISEAYEDSKEIFNNAKSEGYELGYKEGIEAAQDEANKIVQEALDIKRQLKNQKEEMVEKLETDIVSLVISSIEKILYTKVDDSSETILGLIKQGLDKCTYTESLILRVSPEDYDYVVSVRDKILSMAENIDDITVKKDGSLSKGSCVLDTVSGSIDSSIQTQIDNLSQMFRELLGKSDNI